MGKVFSQIRHLLFILFGLLIISCSKPIEADLVISNVNIIDVENGEIIPTRDVIIVGDSIAQINTHTSNQKYLNAQIIDGTGQYLIPGLWDMHTHTWWGYKDFFPLLIANGVTGIREMFGNLEAVKKIRKEIATEEITGPDIITAGPILCGNPPALSTAEIVDSPEKGREIVRAQKKDGADFIKVYYGLEPEVYRAIADECKRQNIILTGHIPNKVKLEEALEANHASIEHFFGVLEYCADQTGLEAIDNARTSRINYVEYYKRASHVNNTYDKVKELELIQLLGNHKAWVCPTFTVYKGFQRELEHNYKDDRIYYIPEYARSGWSKPKDSVLSSRDSMYAIIDKTEYRLLVNLVKPCIDNGVKFLAGSDYMNPYTYPGFSLHEEMQILVEEAGLTPLQALQTATINPAIFLGKEMEFGKIETGKLASLVFLKANPLDDINNTRSIAGVLLRGRYMNGDSLQATIDAIAAKSKLPKFIDTIRETIVTNGIDSGIAEYYQLKKNSPGKYNFDEEQLNSLGYELLGLEMAEEAIEIFKLNQTIYPAYGNGFDSLGDGYLAIGDTTKTIEVWKKSIALGNTVTQSRLDELLKHYGNKNP